MMKHSIFFKLIANTGWSMDDVSTVKNHVFNKEVLLDDGYSHFPADYEMAVAWQRLIEGNFYESDILLLKHELYESIYYDMYHEVYDISLRSAHNVAESVYNWLQALRDLGYTW